MSIDDELARWRQWPGPREEPEDAGEPWAREMDRVDELDDDELGRHARRDRDDS